MLCFEILTFMFAAAIETNIDFPEPDPECSTYDSKSKCEETTKQVKLQPLIVKAIWDTDARRRVLGPVCEWESCSKSCALIEPGREPPAPTGDERHSLSLSLSLSLSKHAPQKRRSKGRSLESRFHYARELGAHV